MKPKAFNFPKEVSDEMVRAILDGRKSVTRRAVKPPYYIDDEEASMVSGLAIHQGTRVTDGMPYPDAPYRPGDLLYVREAWNGDWCDHYIYKAGGGSAKAAGYGEEPKWHPSIHMPKKAARIFLRVSEVRVERLKSITATEAMDEGFTDWNVLRSAWDSTIKKADLSLYGWAANPLGVGGRVCENQ